MLRLISCYEGGNHRLFCKDRIELSIKGLPPEIGGGIWFLAADSQKVNGGWIRQKAIMTMCFRGRFKLGY